jgi:hypothetical protein
MQGKLCNKNNSDIENEETCKCDCKDRINKYWNGYKCTHKLDFNQTCFDDSQCKFTKGLKCLYNHFYRSFKCQCFSNTKYIFL